MRIPDFVVNWLVNRAVARPYFHLHHDDGAEYMRRYWVLGGSFGDTRSRERRGWRKGPLDWVIGRFMAARLHLIQSSDRGRALHDHTRDFAALILRGGYYERLPARQDQPAKDDVHFTVLHWRGPGSIVRHKATDRHSIELPAGHTALTLFMQFGPARPWGFYDHEHGWIPAAKYQRVGTTPEKAA